MVSIANVISISMSSLSATSPSLQDEIKDCGHVFLNLFLACTFLVLLGVVLEEIKLRLAKSYVDEGTGAFVLERERTLKTLGLWLLVIGISGEGGFEIARSWTDGLLQDVSNSLLLNAEAQTGNAAKSAKTAHDEADEAHKEADVAKATASDAKSKAQRANSEAGVAQKRVSEVEAKADTLEKALLSRRLSQIPFASQLKPLKGFPVLIETIPDFEAHRTAEIIRSGLHVAEWQVSPVVVRTDAASLADFFFPGVMVEDGCGPDRAAGRISPSDLWERCSRASAELVKKLNGNGIEANGPRPDPRMPLNTIRVRVALKPMPGQPPENLIVGP